MLLTSGNNVLAKKKCYKKNINKLEQNVDINKDREMCSYIASSMGLTGCSPLSLVVNVKLSLQLPSDLRSFLVNFSSLFFSQQFIPGGLIA